ncbi:kinase-like domain-containing protein [Mycena epipterygia]|nr:kinase-like domain-containing protein [Mycena epipterygia]
MTGTIAVSIVLSLRDPESYKGFLACSQTEAQQLLDLLQDLLDHDSLSVVRPLFFKALLRLSRASGLHPICFPLTGVQKVGQQVAAGGFGDIWKGLLRGQSVSVKVMRLFEDSDVTAVLKEFGREAVIWRQLCHPNLLPFFGVYYLDTRLCLVSLWMENGNILKFLSKESHKIDRLSLILDVALGLEYLHKNHVVHGDLKALNILVTPSCRACIADFGLSSITDAMTVRFTHSTVSARGGTARYQAPELFRGEKAQFCSDVYAFACVCYEILTGKVPFYELPNDVAVMFHIFDGKRPSQTNLCSGTTALDSLWELLQDCWNEKPDKRPTAVQIVERLKSPLIRATTTQSTTDWNEQFSSKFRRSLQVQPLLPSVPQIERMIFGDGLSSFPTRYIF